MDDRNLLRELDKLRRKVTELEGELAQRHESPDQTELIVHWRPDFIRTFVNEAYCRYFGATASELVGASILDVVTPEHRQQVREKIGRLTVDHPVEVDEYRVVRRDGTVGWQQWVDRAIFDGGEITELRSVGHDITDRVSLESQLRRAQTMEAIGLLAGGVAHDFNNLLLVILTRIDLARGEADVTPHLDEIAAAANRATKLNRQLLTLSRSHVLDLESVDLRDVLGRLVLLLRSLVQGEIQVHLERSARSCRVEVDVGRIDQVLIQLAANARDAMPNGGRLLIDVAPVSIEDGDVLDASYVRPPPLGRYIRLRVTDSGPGIDDDELPRIFDPFYTGKRTDAVGLGLSSVWGIVRQHRGYVGVGNVEPHGARFEILLPREEGATPSDAPRSGSVESAYERVLLVEDNDAVRRVMRTALETRGFVVTEARNADEARGAVEEAFVPDLVVMDVVLPGASGPRLFRELNQRFPGLRCLFVSGHAEDAAVAKLLGPRVGYLAKPFSFNELHDAIEATNDTVSDFLPPR